MVKLGNFGKNSSYSQEVCQRLRRASMTMDGVDFVELSLDLIDRQELGRNDRDYKIMLAICRLLLQRNMPVSSDGKSSLYYIDPFGLLMHHIYELFVANFYKYHLSDWNVSSQKVFEWNERFKTQYIPIMKPDLVLEEKLTNRTIVLDTKFTPQTVTNQFGDKKFHSGHLYQMYAYLKTQEDISEQKRVASGILLYPRSELNSISSSIELYNHTINVSCINLSDPWQEIETNLLEMIRAI
jgi:5-methylcytosine-specific restriction enzyme subunit McrC